MSDPVAEKEIADLKALVVAQQVSAGSFRFSEAVAALQSRELVTSKARAVRAELVQVYEEAGRFRDALVGALNANRYEGLVRRREGVPLEAVITSASSTSLVLDLGFGPNEVAMDSFAPDWLLEAGMKTFPPVSPETAAEWKKLVSFGFAIGQASSIEARARDLARVDPEFDRRWDLIREIP